MIVVDGKRSYADEEGRKLDRAMTVELEAAGVGRFTELRGRAVPYNTWADVGWYLEQHAPGSLARSTTAGSGKGLPLLLFHDNRSLGSIVGVSTGWKEAPGGLDGTWRLNDSAEAQQAASLAQSGELGYMSIGFSPIRSQVDPADDWDPERGPDHMDRMTRLESRLVEVSLTPTPAFADAEVTHVRQAAKRMVAGAELEAWRRVYEDLRR